MQGGDLEVWTRPRYVVVLEGVLCNASPIVQVRRILGTKVTGYNLNWHEVPLKRLIYMKEHWPNTAQDIVTFISHDIADEAAEFLMEVGVPADSVSYKFFGKFIATLPYQTDIT